MTEETANPVGRPTLFKPEYVQQVEGLCRIGAIDTDIADFFGVHVDTIYTWKNVYPEFSEAIKRGKAEADREIAEKLFDRASGAEWIEQKEVKLKKTWYDENGKKCEEEMVEVVDLKKAAPPETAAIVFFLKNRRRDLWRDKQDVEHTGHDGAPIAFSGVDLKDLPDDIVSAIATMLEQRKAKPVDNNSE